MNSSKLFGSKMHIKYFLFVLAIFGVAFWYVYQPNKEQGPIYKYNAERDRQDVIDLFKANWYLLISSRDFSTEFMLDNAASSRDPRYLGHFQMRVMRDENKLIGFVGYYKETAKDGRLLFLVVDEKYRGNRYADVFINYVMDDMRSWGLKRLWLLTRATNIKAQKVYLRHGFKQFKYDPEGFVYFEYIL